MVIFAEAVWDHVAIESEELPFNAGDVIEVYNVLDREWWWGMCNGKSGWFPSDFVRVSYAPFKFCTIRKIDYSSVRYFCL